VLDGATDPPMGRGNFGGKERPIVKYRYTLRSSQQKRLNRCVMPFGLWSQNGPSNHELDGSRLQIPMRRGNFGDMVAQCKV